jgi:hypothetical protein
MSKYLQSNSGTAEAEKASNPSLASNENDKLREFYALHDVSVDHVFARTTDGEAQAQKSCHPHRFIRLNPRYDLQETLKLIKVSVFNESACTGNALLKRIDQ